MLKPSDLHALSPLGQGPGTRVWKGLDAKGQPLLLKTFSLAEAPNWKAEELFDREAKVLQHLDHPCLPQLLAYGVEDQTSYLIYRFIEGESLQAKLEAGWRPALDEVIDLFRQLLKTLIWLHDRQPPLVHRDIKPSNLILTADGQLYLIDFGSVIQHLKPQGGSTVAGTFGYMAPEQLGGRALPASDLYGVGASFIHLLSGKSPGELPQARLWIQFENHVQLSLALKHWLNTLIHPVLEERCSSARQALASLETALLAPSVPEKIALSIPNSKQKELDLFRNWPTPIPETGMNAIEVKKVPQGISILLPRREKTNSTLYFLSLFASVMGSTALLSGPLGYDYASLIFSPSYLFQASIITAGLGFQSFGRHQQLSSKQTLLTFDESKLLIHSSEDASENPKWQKIPWSHILSIKLTTMNRGVKLKYTDPKTKKKKQITLGMTLESFEQYWLYGVLTDQQNG